jgi:hypothetical protein
VVCGSFTLMLNTLPAYGAGLGVCYSGMCPNLRGELVPAGVPNAETSRSQRSKRTSSTGTTPTC